MVRIGGLNLNITEELQQTLRDNPPRIVDKPIISKKRDPRNTFVLMQEVDENGVGKTQKATISTHPCVYFDATGNFYLHAYSTTIVEFEGRKVEVLTTNQNIKIAKDSPMYGRGIHSHNQPILGSELWDNGYTEKIQHTERLCKGDPATKIVKIMTRDEVLAVELKPTGDNLMAKVSGASDAEKAVMAEQITGLDTETLEMFKDKDFLKNLKEMMSSSKLLKK